MKKNSLSSVILGAAFLMATSAVGPGFLTQTTVFTGQLLASFGFVILLSIVLDVFAQLNIWRVLTVSGRRGQDVANATVPGSGYLLAALIVFGGLVFNIGNIAGCGLGLQVLFNLDFSKINLAAAPDAGFPGSLLANAEVKFFALLSAGVAIGIFLLKEAGRAMDFVVKILGVVMLGLILYAVFYSQPPLAEAALRTVYPTTVSAQAVVTLVGGTVGGYITFAGAHRLIDAGVTGAAALPQVTKSAVSGIVLTAIIRYLLFLAAFGVIAMGFAIDPQNPPASVFQNAAGDFGYRLFGIVMWSAAITSVIGAAYTSVSFLKTFHEEIAAHTAAVTIGFIAVSLLVFLVVGNPVKILVWAGTINGFILPVGLALVLLAARRRAIVGDYRHPLWLAVSGWLVVAVMLGFSVLTLYNNFVPAK